MNSEMRNMLSMGRQTHYFEIMRTVVFSFVGLAAIIELGGGGYSAPLTMLVVTVTAYGVLAGGTALNDLNNLASDMGDDIAQTNYGQGVKARNIPMLKMISSTLVGLTGLAELYAIFT